MVGGAASSTLVVLRLRRSTRLFVCGAEILRFVSLGVWMTTIGRTMGRLQFGARLNGKQKLLLPVKRRQLDRHPPHDGHADIDLP